MKNCIVAMKTVNHQLLKMNWPRNINIFRKEKEGPGTSSHVSKLTAKLKLTKKWYAFKSTRRGRLKKYNLLKEFSKLVSYKLKVYKLIFNTLSFLLWKHPYSTLWINYLRGKAENWSVLKAYYSIKQKLW